MAGGRLLPHKGPWKHPPHGSVGRDWQDLGAGQTLWHPILRGLDERVTVQGGVDHAEAGQGQKLYPDFIKCSGWSLENNVSSNSKKKTWGAIYPRNATF